MFLRGGFNLLFLWLTVTLEQPRNYQSRVGSYMRVLKPGSSRLDGLTVGLPFLWQFLALCHAPFYTFPV